MKSKGISQLPVLDGDNAIGMVSDASILERFGDDPAALSSSRIGNIMGDPPPRVDERTPLAVLSALLRHSPAVLIVKKEKVVGIVTKADLLKAVSR
jgi:cystathionine beta-synthase